MVHRAAVFVFALAAVLTAQAPSVERFEPAHGATDVAAGRAELRIVFDRDMDRHAGLSIGRDPGGQPFPKVAGTPRWADARTLVLTADLDPGVTYVCVLNGAGTKQALVDSKGNKLPPTEWRFATAAGVTTSPVPVDAAAVRAWNESAWTRLQTAVQEQYSYRDRTGAKWTEVFATGRDEVLAAASKDQFIERAAKVLAAARDPHLWFQLGERIVGTHQTGALPNWNPRVLPKLLPGLRQVNRNVLSARTDDGIGYVAIATFAGPQADDVRAVHQELNALRTCKALIVDVRGNGGGDEGLARPIAAWFVEGRKVYAGHRAVDRSFPAGLGPAQERVVVGNAEIERRFAGRVAVLMGPFNLSSCEAFLLMMKQCERAQLIGARSSGSSGNPQPHELGDGVTLMVPSWQALRPDGTCFEGEGIAPDVEVAATAEELKTRDLVLEQALALLRAAK